MVEIAKLPERKGGAAKKVGRGVSLTGELVSTLEHLKRISGESFNELLERFAWSGLGTYFEKYPEHKPKNK